MPYALPAGFPVLPLWAASRNRVSGSVATAAPQRLSGVAVRLHPEFRVTVRAAMTAQGPEPVGGRPAPPAGLTRRQPHLVS